MAKKYVSQLLDENLAEQWFGLVNECFDAGDVETLKGLRFRKGHPDLVAAPNVAIIYWGYLQAAMETLPQRKIKAREREEWASLDVWPLTPIPFGHAPGYWRRTIEPISNQKSHEEMVTDNLEATRTKRQHLA